jgi:hypothetical protein
VKDRPKRYAPMVQGFIVDRNRGGSRTVSRWLEGAPEKAFWSNTKAPDEKQVPIGTFRRSGCGYLESFADRKFWRCVTKRFADATRGVLETGNIQVDSQCRSCRAIALESKQRCILQAGLRIFCGRQTAATTIPSEPIRVITLEG